MIIGRKEEIAKLRKAYDSEYSEFVAVYGRRRIGKTFLIREMFDGKFTFQYSGIFKLYTPRNKSAQVVLITSNGVIPNNNSFEIPLQVTGDQLFQP